MTPVAPFIQSGGTDRLPEALQPVVVATTGALANLQNVLPDLPAVQAPPPAARAPRPIVEACRTAIAGAASRYGAAAVEASSAGRLQQLANGRLVAPLYARVIYSRAGAMQVRQARISCQLNGSRQVLALR